MQNKWRSIVLHCPTSTCHEIKYFSGSCYNAFDIMAEYSKSSFIFLFVCFFSICSKMPFKGLCDVTGNKPLYGNRHFGFTAGNRNPFLKIIKTKLSDRQSRFIRVQNIRKQICHGNLPTVFASCSCFFSVWMGAMRKLC